MRIKCFTLLCALLCTNLIGQVNYTAKNFINPYDGVFRPGVNMGYFPPWNDFQLADIAAGNPAVGIQGIGAKSSRPGFFGEIVDIFGYDYPQPILDHYRSVGLEELTCIVGFPVEWQRDQTVYCSDGVTQSTLFANLYTDIWDNGENGTPVNDENYFALYMYKLVTRYKDYIRFWEIWNEPGFDFTFNTGWREPGDPLGNWWDRNPDPCEYKLRAPIFHYVRTLRIAYQIIKTYDPDSYVSVAGFGYQSFLDAVLRNTDNPIDGSVTADYPHGGGAYFDVMGFHSYPHFDGSTTNFDQGFFERHSDQAADGILFRRDYYRQILYQHGYDGLTYPEKLHIITEINVPRRQFSGQFIASELAQYNFIIKALINAKLNNIYQMHVYNLSDETTDAEADFEFDIMGLYKKIAGTEPYTQVKNAEGVAYKTASDFIYNTTYDAARTAAMAAPPGIRTYAFQRPDGSYVYAMWAETTIDLSEAASGVYSFPAPFGISELYKHEWNFSQTGASFATSPQDILLNSTPVFLTTSDDIDGDNPPVANLNTVSNVVNGPFSVNVNFSELVSGLSLDDFTIFNGNASNLSGSGQNYNFIVSPVNFGPVTITLPANSVTDQEGNGNFSSNTLTVSYGTLNEDEIDLSMTMTVDKPTFSVFENVTFTLNVTNSGSDPATNVTVSTPFPNDLAYVDGISNSGSYDVFQRIWSIGTIPAGSNATLDLTLFSLSDAKQIVYAQVQTSNSGDIDSTPGNGTCCTPIEDDEAAVTVNDDGGLDTTPPNVTLGTANTTVNDAFTINIIFTEDVNGLAETDFVVSNGTVANLVGAGAAYSLEVTPIVAGLVSVNLPAGSASDVAGNLSLVSNTLDVNYVPIINGDMIDLALTLSANPLQFSQYETITYNLTISNTGTISATGVIVDFQKPDQMAFVEQNISQGSYSDWDGIWNVGTIPAGGAATLEVRLFNLDDSEAILNYAQVIAADQEDIDSTPDNNAGMLPNEDDEAVIRITPSNGGGGDVTPPSAVLSISNPNVNGAFSVEIAFSEAIIGLDLGEFTIANGNPISLVAAGNGQNFTLAIDPIAEGVVFISLPAERVEDAAGNANLASNVLEVNYSLGGGNGVDLALELEADKSDYRIFENVTYTLRVKNTGDEGATGVVVEFPLPDGLVYTMHNTSRGDFSDWTGDWNIGRVAAGESEVLELTLYTLVGSGAITNFAQVVAQDQSDQDSNPDNNNSLSPLEDDEAAWTINPQSAANRQANENPVIRLDQSRMIQIAELYPNPATHQLQVLLHSGEKDFELTSRIYSVLGKEMMLQKDHLDGELNLLQFQIDQLPSGVYYLLFESPHRHEPIVFVKQQ
ncbi:MAG: Ig-like domain-containing protein, partial [Bacteroidota bacterium]